MARGMEVLKASKPGAGKKLSWCGQNTDVGNSARGNRHAILRAGGVPTNTIVAGGDQACDPHERGLRAAESGFADHSRHFPARREDGYCGRHDANGGSRARERSAAPSFGKTVQEGRRWR